MGKTIKYKTEKYRYIKRGDTSALHLKRIHNMIR